MSPVRQLVKLMIGKKRQNAAQIRKPLTRSGNGCWLKDLVCEYGATRSIHWLKQLLWGKVNCRVGFRQHKRAPHQI